MQGLPLGFFAFALGAIVGSYLNVLVLRYNTGKTHGGRSMCFSCGKQLGVHELVPIASYLFQRGRCRGCGSGISKQYILVELLTAVTFYLIYYKTLGAVNVSFEIGLTLFAMYAFMFALLIAISVYDMRHKIIPDLLVYLFAAAALGRSIYMYQLGVITSRGNLYLYLGSGVVLASFFAALWFVSRGKWMGLGDAKLALGIGWLLPFPQNVTAIFMAFWVGAIVGIGLMLVSKFLKQWRKGRPVGFKSELPFAPFLVVGVYVVFFMNWSILSWGLG